MIGDMARIAKPLNKVSVRVIRELKTYSYKSSMKLSSFLRERTGIEVK